MILYSPAVPLGKKWVKFDFYICQQLKPNNDNDDDDDDDDTTNTTNDNYNNNN